MTSFYKNTIAQAMMAEAEGMEEEALTLYKEAHREAKVVDPCGPRVMETRAYLDAFYQKYPHMSGKA